tara:strand:- start:5536 stop:5838 length:303 start_codon:yes stop_codon:yes gene_type:complete
MSTEQRNKAHNDISRADRVRQVLEDPYYKEGMAILKAELYVEFGRIKWDDKDKADKLDDLHKQFQAVEKFESRLENSIISGKLAQQTLTMLDQHKKLEGL